MSPEEKAEELIKKYKSLDEWVGGEGYIGLSKKMAKQCAIICVEQAMIYHPLPTVPDSRSAEFHEYWKEVLDHIKNS